MVIYILLSIGAWEWVRDFYRRLLYGTGRRMGERKRKLSPNTMITIKLAIELPAYKMGYKAKRRGGGLSYQREWV